MVLISKKKRKRRLGIFTSYQRGPDKGIYEKKPSCHMSPIQYEDVEFEPGRYEMDDDGRIYDNKFSCWLHLSRGTGSLEYPGEYYLSVRVYDAHGRVHKILWHRLVAATFLGDVRDKQVHHKDEHPEHCHPSNLEILDEGEHHSHHAHGESNGRAKLTEPIVHEICQMLADGMTLTQIADVIVNQKGIDITSTSINMIRIGKNWNYISKDYDFYRGPLETPGRQRDSTIYGVPRIRFEYLCAHLRLPAREVASILGIDISNREENMLLNARIKNIRRDYNSRMYKLIPKKQTNMN